MKTNMHFCTPKWRDGDSLFYLGCHGYFDYHGYNSYHGYRSYFGNVSQTVMLWVHFLSCLRMTVATDDFPSLSPLPSSQVGRPWLLLSITAYSIHSQLVSTCGHHSFVKFYLYFLHRNLSADAVSIADSWQCLPILTESPDFSCKKSSYSRAKQNNQKPYKFNAHLT